MLSVGCKRCETACLAARRWRIGNRHTPVSRWGIGRNGRARSADHDRIRRCSIGPMTNFSPYHLPLKRCAATAPHGSFWSPDLGHMRQDAAFRPGEAISQKVVGRLLSRLVDRVITVDAHLHRTASIHDVFPGIEAELYPRCRRSPTRFARLDLTSRIVVVGPDMGIATVGDSSCWPTRCDLNRCAESTP